MTKNIQTLISTTLTVMWDKQRQAEFERLRNRQTERLYDINNSANEVSGLREIKINGNLEGYLHLIEQ